MNKTERTKQKQRNGTSGKEQDNRTIYIERENKCMGLEVDDLRREYFKIGMEAFEKGNNRRAYQYFSMAAVKEPLWPEAIFRRAQTAYYEGSKLTAAQEAVRALRLEPALERLFDKEGFQLEFVLSQLNSLACQNIGGANFTAAKEYLDMALSLKPDYVMGMLTMAELLTGLGDSYDALEWLEKAVDREPVTAGKLEGYGCYTSLKPYVRYAKIIGEEGIAEEAAKSLFLLGVEKYQSGGKTGWAADLLLESGGAEDLARALDYDPRVIRLAPQEFTVETVVSAINKRVCDIDIPKEKFQEGIDSLKRCIRIQPQNTLPYLTMAELYVAAGNGEEAVLWLRKAVELLPEIKGKLDTYPCFAPLQSNQDYQALLGKKDGKGKSFYYLEMRAEPGGMREDFRMVSVHGGSLRQMMTARLKAGLGFYALLSYGQTIRVTRYTAGKQTEVLDIRPFLKITVPGKLTAAFTEEGEPVIQDAAGNTAAAGYVSELLCEYRAYEEEAETVWLGDWEGRLGALTEELLDEQEEVEIEDVFLRADRVYELESGENYSLEEFVAMIKEEN